MCVSQAFVLNAANYLNAEQIVRDHFDQTTILLTIAGDLASSLAWWSVYDVYTVHVQHNIEESGVLPALKQPAIVEVIYMCEG